MSRESADSPKTRPLRLDDKAYAKLQRKILERDGWRCQGCGARQNLQVHHQQFRSHTGSDTEDNLITLCVGCHENIHGRRERPRLKSAPHRSSEERQFLDK